MRIAPAERRSLSREEAHVKAFVYGVLLGAALVLLGGLAVGPNITLSGMWSDVGSRGKYDFQIDDQGGVTRYVILDTESGAATIMTPDGKTITMQSPQETQQ